MWSMAPDNKPPKIDYFTPDDFNYVATRVAATPDDLILVGGQAVATWALVYDVPPPPSRFPALTSDTDWFGDQRAAQHLCEALESDQVHVNYQLEDPLGHSPNTAAAILEREKRRLFMDFLNSVTGIDDKEIKRLALEITVNGNTFKIMHPLHCLISRFANLKAYSQKRSGSGPAQATWMIEIAREYLISMIREDRPPKQVAESIRMIVKLAEYEPGKYCFVKMGLDPLEAIPNEAVTYAGEGFAQKEWPRIIARIARNRISWLPKVQPDL